MISVTEIGFRALGPDWGSTCRENGCRPIPISRTNCRPYTKTEEETLRPETTEGIHQYGSLELSYKEMDSCKISGKGICVCVRTYLGNRSE